MAADRRVGHLRRARLAGARRAGTVGPGQRPHHQQPRSPPAPTTSGTRRLPARRADPLRGLRALDARRHSQGQALLPCNSQRPDYADSGHPRTTAIREERVLAALDPWLGQLTDPDHRADTVDAVLAAEADQPAEPAEIQTARRALRDLPVELDRMLAAIRAGMDPDLATSTTKQIQRELAAAQATIASLEHANQPSPPLTADDINRALGHAGDLSSILQDAERETRARLYQALDLVLNLDPVGDPPTVDVRLQLCGGGGRI